MPHRIVEVKPHSRDRVRVTLSGGRFFTIPAKKGDHLACGQDLPDAEVERLDRIDQYFRGRDRAMWFIARRERSRHEVDAALAARGIAPSIRAGILGELKDLGLIDDLRFAREFVRTKAELRFLGPHRLRFDLRRRGVARAVIDKAIDEAFHDETSQVDRARALVERKTRGAFVDGRVVRRMADLLKRRGYDYEVVNQVTIELLHRADGQLSPNDE